MRQGSSYCNCLQTWRHELATDGTRFSLAEWRRWLAQQLDANTFRDTAVESPVLFTHLAATRWRSFDAVLLLGCDAAHLPAPVNAGQWFNDAVRASLGLPLSSAQQQQERDDLLALLALNDTVLVTWQASLNGEAESAQPAFRDAARAASAGLSRRPCRGRIARHAAKCASAQRGIRRSASSCDARIPPVPQHAARAHLAHRATTAWSPVPTSSMRATSCGSTSWTKCARNSTSAITAAGCMPRCIVSIGEFPLLQNHDRGQLEDALQRISSGGVRRCAGARLSGAGLAVALAAADSRIPGLATGKRAGRLALSGSRSTLRMSS